MTPQNTDGTKPALLFVPDISGFTQFVQTTEITHSRHIIEELLEKLIEANDLGLQVSEVEGDAILFYRFGHPPTAEARTPSRGGSPPQEPAPTPAPAPEKKPPAAVKNPLNIELK